MENNDKFIVERYLDQVKILTALATTLLITPNLYLSLLEKSVITNHIAAVFPGWKILLLITNVMFLLAILSTYFIYSSVVGSLAEKAADIIYRPFTRIISILQFVFLTAGCIGLLLIFNYSL